MISQEEIISTELIKGADKRSSRPEGPRILLVEDDRALRRFLEISLGRAGFSVFAAADGIEAIKMALSMPIDIVVTDAIMPNLNGYELCRFFRNSPQLSRLPIVLLSALEGKDAARDAAQADAFLVKPVTTEDLTETIEALLAVAT